MLNDTQIGDIWVLFSDFIDKKQIEAVAERYVELLADFGVTDRTLEAASGVDSNLDAAIEYYLDDGEEADDIDELDF
jgi:hypothetical protein